MIIFGLKFFSICPLIFKTGLTRLTESFCFINVTNDPNWLSTSCLTFDLRRALGRAGQSTTDEPNKQNLRLETMKEPEAETHSPNIPDQRVVISNSDQSREAAFL